MTKIAGIVLLILGIEALVVSLLAEKISYVPGPGFGLYQTAGTIGGVLLALLGIVLARRK
jgi:hypothetical protein